ncbi:MAG: InlB B-repeat-containing protein [Clostridia bacterium]|nr:InlB B-repeat-containing protein [Clostridia bacterium]
MIKHLKKAFVIFLALSMCLALLPSAAFADEEVFYVVGNFSHWSTDEAYKMTKKTVSGVTEYTYTMDLTTEDQFKIVGVLNGEQFWYPEGMGNNYGENGEIKEDGTYIIRFDPNAGTDDWFYNFINAEKYEPADDTAAICLYANGKLCDSREFNVDDTFTVYTSLNTAEIDSGRVANIIGKQCYSTTVKCVNELYDNDSFYDVAATFPVMGNKAMGGIENAGDICFSGSTPGVVNPFIFDSDDDLLIVTQFQVMEAGNVSISTDLQLLALPDEEFTKVINNYNIADAYDGKVHIISSFEKPSPKQPLYVDTWDKLEAALETGGDIVLTADVTPDDPSDYNMLSVPKKKTATLDLNGHVINRGLTEAADWGSVFSISGSLTIKDSNPTAEHEPAITYIDPVTGETVTVLGGIITGGYPTVGYSGGGALVADGTLNMEGGTICGCTAVYGGGVCTLGGTFNMTGGSICGCTAGYGGGVCTLGGTFNMTGGTVCGCYGEKGGAVYSNESLYIKGSSFINNASNDSIIYADGPDVSINHNVIISGSGGASIYIKNPPDGTVKDTSLPSLEKQDYVDSNWCGNFSNDYDYRPPMEFEGDSCILDYWYYLKPARVIDENTGEYSLTVTPYLYSCTVQENASLEITPETYLLPEIRLSCTGEGADFGDGTAITLNKESFSTAAFEVESENGGYTYTVGVSYPAGTDEYPISETLTFERTVDINGGEDITYGSPAEISISALENGEEIPAKVIEGKTVSVTARGIDNDMIAFSTADVSENGTFELDLGDISFGEYEAEITIPGFKPATVSLTVPHKTYPLYIAGVQFTSDNLTIDSTDNADIASGTAKYEPGNNKLILDGFKYSGAGNTTEGRDSALYYNGENDLAIFFKGENSLTLHKDSGKKNVGTGICCEENASFNFTGEDKNASLYASVCDGYNSSYGIICNDLSLTMGTLTGEAGDAASDSAGVYCHRGNTTVSNGTLKCIAHDATATLIATSTGFYSKGELTLENSTLICEANTATCTDSGSLAVSRGLCAGYITVTNSNVKCSSGNAVATDGGSHSYGIYAGRGVTFESGNITGLAGTAKAATGITLPDLENSVINLDFYCGNSEKDAKKTDLSDYYDNDLSFPYVNFREQDPNEPQYVDTWGKLEDALSDGGDIVLTADVTPDDPSDLNMLSVPKEKTATLDLNGHVINRGLTEAADWGSVFSISGSLTIKDSNPKATHDPAITVKNPNTGDTVTVLGGIIKGGYTNLEGGAINIKNGICNMEGGTIFSCRAGYGGGVYVSPGSTLNMTGGAIYGCESDSGAAIYSDGAMHVTGATFMYNSGNDIFNSQTPAITMNHNVISEYADKTISVLQPPDESGIAASEPSLDVMRHLDSNWYKSYFSNYFTSPCDCDAPYSFWYYLKPERVIDEETGAYSLKVTPYLYSTISNSSLEITPDTYLLPEINLAFTAEGAAFDDDAILSLSKESFTPAGFEVKPGKGEYSYSLSLAYPEGIETDNYPETLSFERTIKVNGGEDITYGSPMEIDVSALENGEEIPLKVIEGKTVTVSLKDAFGEDAGGFTSTVAENGKFTLDLDNIPKGTYLATFEIEGFKPVVEALLDTEPVKYPLFIGGVQFTDEKLTVDAADNGDITAGSATYDPKNRKLELNGFKYKGAGSSAEDADAALLYTDDDDLTICFKGENSLQLHKDSDIKDIGAGICGCGEGALNFIGEDDTASIYAFADGHKENFGVKCDTLNINTGSLKGEGGSASEISLGIYCGLNDFSVSNAKVTGIGGNVDGTMCAYSSGIEVDGTTTLEDCTILADGHKVTNTTDGITRSCGLLASEGITAKNSTVICTADEAEMPESMYDPISWGFISNSTVSFQNSNIVCSGKLSATNITKWEEHAIDLPAFCGSSEEDAEITDFASFLSNQGAYKYVNFRNLYIYNVTVTPGDGMLTADGTGAESQQVEEGGAMDDVIYMAVKDCYFPEDYAVSGENGITVTRDSFSQITVSGTPEGNAGITLPAATAKEKAGTPALSVTQPTEKGGAGTINAGADCEISADNGASWQDCEENMSLQPGNYLVRVKATDTVLASDAQEIEIEAFKASVTFNANGGSVTPADAVADEDGKLSDLPTPERSKYKFKGWYTESEGGESVTEDTVFTKDTEIFAQWSKKSGGGGLGGANLAAKTEDKEVDKLQFILTIGKKEAIVWGEEKVNDVAPMIRNDRTMLPARFIAENLGAEVSWDNEARKVIITKDKTKIEIIIDSSAAYLNGEEVTLDSPAFIENDRTYTPLRFIAEALGAKVNWKDDLKQVIITK